MEHELKTWPEFFAPLLAGDKTFEIRKDDRGYAVGDVLWLREWHKLDLKHTGRAVRRRVTYITRHMQQGDMVVMGLTDV